MIIKVILTLFFQQPLDQISPPNQPKAKKKVDRTKANEANTRYYYNLKKNPYKYKIYQKKQATYKATRFQHFPKEEQDKERKKIFLQKKAYDKRKKEENPDFKKKDKRTELRQRVHQGTATEEDMKQFHILCEKNLAAVNKHLSRSGKGKKKDSTPSKENQRPAKKRRTGRQAV